jgi:hypothetical protein
MLVGEHAMKLGVTLPLSDIGGDRATVRVFAQAAEAAGYDHPGAPDHGRFRPISSTIHSSCSDFSAVARPESASRHKC